MPTWLPEMSKASTVGTGALSWTILATQSERLDAVRFKLAAQGATAGNFTVTLASDKNAAHNTLLFSQDMSATTDVNQTTGLGPIAKGDSFVLAYSNLNGRTWGAEVYMSRIEGT